MFTLQQVSFAYHHTPVLRDLTLSIAPNQCVGVLGANGSGKSTLLKLLARLLTPRTGQITYDGEPLAQLPRGLLARTIGYVPQETHVAFPLRARDLVMLGRLPHAHRFGWETDADREAVDRALTTMACTDFADRLIHDLSGGERQRVLIARALAQQPTVLICDEPTTHLDLRHQVECLRLLTTHGDQHPHTIILALHDLNLAAHYCDTLCLLHDGRVHLFGPPGEVLQPEIMTTVFQTPLAHCTDLATGMTFYAPGT